MAKLEDKVSVWRRQVERQLQGHASAAAHALAIGDTTLLTSWAEWLLRRAVLIYLAEGLSSNFTVACAQALAKWNEGLERARHYDCATATLFVAVALALNDREALRFAASAPQWLETGSAEWKQLRRAILAVRRGDHEAFVTASGELEGLLSAPNNNAEGERLNSALLMLKSIHVRDGSAFARARKDQAALWQRVNRVASTASLDLQFDFLDWGLAALAQDFEK